MEDDANRSRQAAEALRTGDKVWLNLKNINTPQLSKKLAWTQAKYTVEKEVSPMVYELANLPSGIHNRFHVDLLRRAATDPLPSQETDDAQPPPLIPQTEEHEEEYKVERILRAERKRVGRGFRREVLVKWHGYAEPTWEPRNELQNNTALDEFEDQYGKGDNVGEEAGSHSGPRRRKPPQKKLAAILELAGSWQNRCAMYSLKLSRG
jgi:hypothetical protein